MNGGNQAAFVVGACLTGAVAWWLISANDETDAPPPTTTTREGDAQAPESHDETPTGTVKTSQFKETETPKPEAGTTFVVEVVSKEDGSPVPDATVTSTDLGGWRAKSQELTPDERRNAKALLEAFTSEGKTDETGRITVPRFDTDARIEARSDTHWGIHYFRDGSPKDDVFKLRVSVDRNIHVKVVDGAGSPRAGVPVTLRMWQPGRDEYRNAEPATSGPEGMAVLEHVQDIIGHGETWQLTFAFPMVEPPTVEVGLEAMPQDVVVLQAPDTGTVVVRTVNTEGKPAGDAVGNLYLTAHAGNPDSTPEIWPGAPWNRGARDGHPQMVALGLRFRGRAMPRDRAAGLQPAITSIAGPTTTDESVTLTLHLGRERFPVLTGRLVTNEGAPIASKSFCAIDRLEPRDGKKYETWQRIETDEQGRFRLVVRETCPADGKYWCEIQQLDASGGFQTDAPLTHLDVARFTSPVDHEIGDVIVDHGALLVSGQTVGPDGKPFEGARILVMVNQGSAWIETNEVFTRDLGEGRFSIHWPHGSTIPNDPMRLRVHHRSVKSSAEGTPFTPGTSGLRLVVALERGQLEGSVLTDDGRRFQVVVVRLDGKQRLSTAVRRNGEFGFHSLEAGRYNVAIQASAATATDPNLALIRDVVVEAGVTNKPEALQNIVVTTSGPRLIKLTVLDPEGRPVMRASVAMGPVAKLHGFTDRDGTAVVPAPDGSVVVTVGASGFRTQRVEGVNADTTITLKSAISVRLDVTNAAALGDLRKQVSARLEPLTPDSTGNLRLFPKGDIPTPISEAGTLQVLAPGPGQYEIRWLLTKSRARSTSIYEVPQESADRTRIVIADDGTSQQFTVTAPKAAIEERSKNDQ